MDFVRFRVFQRVSGWKQAARVNIVILVVMSITLSACFIASAVQTGRFTAALFFYEGSCDTASKLNVALHLLLNGISTAVLASSNFFMQVLNAPSRDDVDKAHAMGSWLGIGVPSIRSVTPAHS
jgi:RsiW-degrading membrane proteinase PrsW (M82 family)